MNASGIVTDGPRLLVGPRHLTPTPPSAATSPLLDPYRKWHDHYVEYGDAECGGRNHRGCGSSSGALDHQLRWLLSSTGRPEGGGFFLASHHGTDVAAFAGLSWSASGNLTGWSLNDTAVPDAGTGAAYDASGDANSAKYSVSVMSFGSAATTPPSGDQMGVGGFHFNTSDKKLYVRVD